jgi:hypothetical protein
MPVIRFLMPYVRAPESKKKIGLECAKGSEYYWGNIYSPSPEYPVACSSEDPAAFCGAVGSFIIDLFF